VGPCIVVYDDYNLGRNIIESNVAINSGTQDNGIQASAGATIINNIVVNSLYAGIAIVPNDLYYGSEVRNITVSQNTVYLPQQDAALRLNSPTGVNIIISNNVFYAGSQYSITSATNLASIVFANNAVNGSVNANGIQTGGTFNVGAASSIFTNVNTDNFYPIAGSPLIAAGSGTYGTPFDFNYNTRSLTSPTVGAYEYSTPTNPGCGVGDYFECGSYSAPIDYPSSSPLPSAPSSISSTISVTKSISKSVSISASKSVSKSITNTSSKSKSKSISPTRSPTRTPSKTKSK
jgi:hypothetical protein